MPCRDGYEFPMSISYEGHISEMAKIRERLDLVTRVACEAMTIVEEHAADHDVSVQGLISKEAANWWKKHQEEDDIRKENLRKSAYGKLTPEEREVLGL